MMVVRIHNHKQNYNSVSVSASLAKIKYTVTTSGQTKVSHQPKNVKDTFIMIIRLPWLSNRCFINVRMSRIFIFHFVAICRIKIKQTATAGGLAWQ